MFFSFARQPTRDEEEARTQQQFQDYPVRSINVPAPISGVSSDSKITRTTLLFSSISINYFLQEVVDKVRQMFCTDECYQRAPKYLHREPELMLQAGLPTNRVVVKL